MKLLFLDVDGVLNEHVMDPLVMCGQIHAEKVKLLNGVLADTGALIVVSSAWRYLVHRGEMNLLGLDWLLRSHGVYAGKLHGITRPDTMERGPSFSGDPRAWPVTDERGQQITDYLAGVEGVTSYAVVDDLDPGITAAGHPLVRTDSNRGLTWREAERLVSILNG